MSEQDPHPHCLFCRIVAGTAPSTQVYADDEIVVIQDINPQAPVHVLVIPRRHIATIADVRPEDGPLLAHIFGVAARVARERGLDASGYRVVINHGRDAGQTVHHLHVHLLGGRPMKWPPG
jgi:histidine triad (HIT) family protein